MAVVGLRELLPSHQHPKRTEMQRGAGEKTWVLKSDMFKSKCRIFCLEVRWFWKIPPAPLSLIFLQCKLRGTSEISL